MTDYVVTGLMKRRAELTGEIEATHERLRVMVKDLESLDATILQFAPEMPIEAIKPKTFRPPADWSNRGQMMRLVFSTLRQTTEPMTTREIAMQILVERALNASDVRLLRLMTKRVGVVLRDQRNSGRVRSEQGPGQYMLWELSR